MFHRLRSLALLVFLAMLAGCDSGAPETPPVVTPPIVTPPIEVPPVTPPVEPPAPEAFSLAVTVRDAGGAAVEGVPVSLRFFPRSAATARPMNVEASPVFPSPWQALTSIQLLLSDPTSVRAELLDVLGTRRRLIFDDQSPAGDLSLVFPDVDDEGRGLPGGAYVVRLVAGPDTLLRYTILSDPSGKDSFHGANRTLGTTDASGQVSTTDRTAVPAFYVPDIDFLLTDDFGRPLGSARFGLDMEVVVGEPGDERARLAVTVRDGANVVEVRLP